MCVTSISLYINTPDTLWILNHELYCTISGMFSYTFTSDNTWFWDGLETTALGEHQ
jgi:hypothetical protein